ncbi:MAG: glycosyltransferase family 2 protein [Hyphomonadaceae bacterium]|nr:glycosyltransferase family 2 protein [Hyphomonadaceae bacterium]
MTGSFFTDFITSLAETVAAIVIGVGLLQNLVYLLQLAIAQRTLSVEPPEPRVRTLWRRSAANAPPIALLAPAYNEAATIENSTRSLLALNYPDFEVIIINDGSTDDTMGVLKRAFALQLIERTHDTQLQHQPIEAIYRSAISDRLVVVDKVNGGKADALNAGLNMARAPIVCSIDADSMLEPDALLRAVQPFVEDPQAVVATGGTVRIANGCVIKDGRVVRIGVPRNFWALLQSIEYLRAFLLARLAWSKVGALTIVSGAFGLFRRSVLIEIGGYKRDTVGEDMELVVRLHRHFRERGRAYRIAFVPEPVCWTEAPETLKVLARQRARWHRGALETFVTHRRMFLNPQYGRAGMLGMGQVFLFDVLGPVVEVAGFVLVPLMWALGILSLDYLLAFLAVTFALGVAVSVGSLAIEEAELRRYPKSSDLAALAVAAVVENFGYRQLNSLWRLRGLWEWARGVKSWGEMSRRGFQAS